MKRAGLALLFATTAMAAEPPDIKGLRLGMTEAEAVAVIPTLRCRANEKSMLTERSCIDPKNTIAGHPARMFVGINDGVLTGITTYYGRAALKDVLTAAGQKFGKATAVVEGRHLWAVDDNRLTLSCPAAPSRDCYFSLTNQAQIDRFIEQQKRDSAARFKDM